LSEKLEVLREICTDADASELLRIIEETNTKPEPENSCWIESRTCIYGGGGKLMNSPIESCLQCSIIADYRKLETFQTLSGLMKTEDPKKEILAEIKKEMITIKDFLEDLLKKKKTDIADESAVKILNDFLKILTNELGLGDIKIIDEEALEESWV